MTYPIKEITEKLKKHLSEISDEQFEQELIEAGIEKCPYIVGIDLASGEEQVNDYSVVIIDCPRCQTRNYIRNGFQDKCRCSECNARFNILTDGD